MFKRNYAEYSAESSLKNPRAFFRLMLCEIISSKELALRLCIRDISAQYRQAFLGLTWAFLPPLATAMLFILLAQGAVLQIEGLPVSYTTFVFLSTLLWQAFVDAVNAPLKTMSQSKGMLAKVKIPYEALILSSAGNALFSTAIRAVILLAIYLFLDAPVTWGIVGSIIPLTFLILLGLFIGVLLTPLSVLYADVTYGVSLVLQLWMFATPVVFPVPKEGLMATICQINPVTPLLNTARELLLGQALSEPFSFAIVALGTLFGLFFSIVLYRISVPFIVERMCADT